MTEESSSGGGGKTPHTIQFLPCAKRVRVFLGDALVADSTETRLLRETGHTPVYYFPRDSVDQDLLEPSERESFCPFKGTASYWHVRAGGRRADDAVWSYRSPLPEVAGIKDYLAFYWDRMDSWFEEDEEVFVHARDPFVRVDVLESARPVTVTVDGQEVARSTRARFLFETGLPTRYYLPREDVRAELLEPSETRSACPYKGTAGYYHLRLGDTRHEDLVWTYADPLPEVAKIKDFLCFFNERVESVSIEGEAETRPETKWSAPV